MDTKTHKQKTDSPEPKQGTQGSHAFTLTGEDVIRKTIGCAIDIHREVEPGYLEAMYHRAMCIALSLRHLPFSTEHHVEVVYRGHRVGFQRLDRWSRAWSPRVTGAECATSVGA
jgi:hypothetical protein